MVVSNLSVARASVFADVLTAVNVLSVARGFVPAVVDMDVSSLIVARALALAPRPMLDSSVSVAESVTDWIFAALAAAAATPVPTAVPTVGAAFGALDDSAPPTPRAKASEAPVDPVPAAIVGTMPFAAQSGGSTTLLAALNAAALVARVGSSTYPEPEEGAEPEEEGALAASIDVWF